MIYIQKYDNIPLPSEFHYINNICAILYDQIVNGFRYNDYKDFYSKNINIKGVDLKSFSSDDEIINFLLKNQYRSELNDFLTKKISNAVIADFSHFVYQAIEAAKKCKVTVAFSLIRKPFTDNLTILERLFLDPDEFINNFYIDGDIKKYDPSYNNKNKNLNHFGLIKECHKKMKYNTFIFSSLIYDVRYDKSFKGAIQELTNKSIHVVTNDKNYKTEAKNLNYIFDAVTNVDQFLETFYRNVYYLLLYSAAIVDELYFRYLTDKNHSILRKTNALKRLLSVVLVDKYTQDKTDLDILKTTLMIFENVDIECSACQCKFKPTGTDLQNFFFEDNITCPQCLDLIFDSEDSLNSFLDLFDPILNLRS